MIKRSLRRFRLLAPIAVLPIIALACLGSTPTPQANNSLQAALTANDVSIQVSATGANPQSLQKFETINASPGSRITLDQAGRGVLRFGDRNEVDLFGNTEVTLEDAKLEPGGSTFVRVKQTRGHTHFKLNPDSIVRVILETDDSTITTLEQGTEFTVCFSPGKLTCIAVREGSIEVTSQAEKRIFRKGEATFYNTGELPQPPVCIREDEFNAWLASMRGQQSTPPLSELVKTWASAACLIPTQAGEATIPPPVETLHPTAPPTESIPTAPPTEFILPTPTWAPPSLPYARILQITIDENNRYVVEYETYGYIEALPGQHVHFFFNTVPPEQAGVPGVGPWILYGGPRPFTGYSVHDRPSGATQMCILVANHDHSVQYNTGNCVDLPG